MQTTTVYVDLPRVKRPGANPLEFLEHPAQLTRADSRLAGAPRG